MSEGLPAGWHVAEFATVATIAANLVSPAGYQAHPHIAPDNIARNTGQLLPHRTIAEDKMTSAKHLFRPGQLLYSKIRPYLNKCVRVDFEGLCSADMYPLDAHIDPVYLHYYILSEQFVSAVSKASGSRTVLPKTNQQQLSRVPVPVAPMSEQARIAEALESYFTRLDDAVATLERVERNLKRYRASVLKSAVEGRLVPTEASLAKQEGRDYEPADVLLERILAERRRRWEEAELAKLHAAGKPPKNDKWKAKYKEPTAPDTTNLPDLPEGWCWASLISLCSAIGDVDHRMPKARESGVPYVSTRDFSGFNDIDFENAKKISGEDYSRLCRKIAPEAGDILLSRYGTVGEVRFITASAPRFQASYSVAIVKPLPLAPTPWMALALRSDPLQAEMRTHVRATAQPDLGLAHIRELMVPLAPLQEQLRITERVDDLLSVAEASGMQVVSCENRCSRLRQAVLKWAFEGKLADQEPNDEPASVLLKSIQAERDSAKPTPKVRRQKGGGRKVIRA